MTDPDKLELKQRERKNWSSAAEGWRRRDELLRKGSAPVTERMLELTRIIPGSHVLDIASGTGEPALSLARIVGESGKIIATDLVDEMLAVARDKANNAKIEHIEFHCIDAEKLDLAEGSFDAVTIRWGLMFMPEPQACLAAAHNALKPEGRICLTCWSEPEKNPFVGVLMKTLRSYMDVPVPTPGSPGIFAFADPVRLKDILASTGFRNVSLEEMEIDVIEVENGRNYWEVISDLAAPVMALVEQLDASTRADYIDDVIRTADAMKQGETLRMKGTTWIVSANK